MQGSHSGRRSAVRSGLLTGLSTAAVSGSAALAGAILSRKFGHGVETDGFFAAYAVYVALVLVASALRVVVLPEFARAQDSRQARPRGRLVGARARGPARAARRGRDRRPARGRRAADREPAGAGERRRSCLPWLIPAAAAQVYAGIAASALAALDDYGTAALGYGAGAVAGLVVIVALVDHGVQAFGWGLAVNGASRRRSPARCASRAGGARAARRRRRRAGCGASSKASRCRSRSRGST